MCICKWVKFIGLINLLSVTSSCGCGTNIAKNCTILYYCFTYIVCTLLFDCFIHQGQWTPQIYTSNCWTPKLPCRKSLASPRPTGQSVIPLDITFFFPPPPPFYVNKDRFLKGEILSPKMLLNLTTPNKTALDCFSIKLSFRRVLWQRPCNPYKFYYWVELVRKNVKCLQFNAPKEYWIMQLVLLR